MRERRNFNQGYKSNFLIGRASVAIVFLGLVFMFGMLYLSQANGLAARTDSLHDLENRKKELVAEKERLQVEATRLQSIKEIQKATNSNSGTKYVPIQKINYLPSSSVALK